MRKKRTIDERLDALAESLELLTGMHRATEFLRQCPLTSARDTVQAMLAAVAEFSPKAAEQNDLTALALVRPRRN